MNGMEQIAGRIRSGGEDARFETWLEIYFAPDAAEKVLRQVVEGSDAVIKVSLARFLAHVEDFRAAGYLAELLLDAEPSVVKAAKSAFDRLDDPDKLKRLGPVLDAVSVEARKFAVERLSRGGRVEFIPHFLAMIEDAHSETALHVLACLRHLPDKTLFAPLLPYMTHPEENFRFKAALVYGALYENGHWGARNVLVAALQDASPRVRQSVLWALRRRRSRWNRGHFIAAAGDPDPSVREEALLGLSAFPNAGTVGLVLKALESDAERAVTLRAEGVLLNFPPPVLVRGLWRFLRKNGLSASGRAVKLLADFDRNSPRLRRYVERKLAASLKPRESILCMEVLGACGDARSIPLLETYVGANPVLTYAAMAAILRIRGDDPSWSMEAYLEPSRLPPLVLQMLLKHLARTAAKGVSGAVPVGALTRLLESPNQNVRLLAAQVLLKTPGEKSLAALCDAAAREPDAALLLLLRDGLRFRLAREPGTFRRVLDVARSRPDAVREIWTALRGAELAPEDAENFLEECATGPARDFPRETGGVLAALLKTFRIGFARLWEVSARFADADAVLGAVAENLEESAFTGALDVPLDDLLAEMRRPARCAAATAARFLKYAEGAGAAAALAGAAFVPVLADYRDALKDALARVIARAAS